MPQAATRQSSLRLPGEPENSDDLDEVRHWALVYRELLAGFRDLVRVTPKTHRAGRLGQVRQLELRFRYWDSLCRDLMGTPVLPKRR